MDCGGICGHDRSKSPIDPPDQRSNGQKTTFDISADGRLFYLGLFTMVAALYVYFANISSGSRSV